MNTKCYLKNLTLLCASLLIITLSGCDKDKEEVAPEYTIDDFVGSWIATSLVHTNHADPGQNFDVVANGGEVRFTTLNGGGTRTWIEMGALSDEYDAQFTMSGNTITSTPEEAARGVRVYTFEYDGTTLMLTNTNDSFDFTLSGDSVVATTSVGQFVRH